MKQFRKLVDGSGDGSGVDIEELTGSTGLTGDGSGSSKGLNGVDSIPGNVSKLQS
jgi:hypothetical protein